MDNKVRDTVRKVIDDIRKDGDSAVCRYIRQFDGIDLSPRQFLVKENVISSACKKISKENAAAIKDAIGNIRSFHEKEYKNCARSWFFSNKGAKLGQIISPIQKVGIYIPGGMHPYPSTIFMTAIPAKVAGVKELIILTPPKKEGISPELLYTAALAGVRSVYQVGGPMAIAAMAFGTGMIPRVDLIAGPGNIYVAEAKRQLYGEVGIDMVAGPSEVAILCDRHANIEYVASDLGAQIEHDVNSKGYVFCDDREFIQKVRDAVSNYMKYMKGKVEFYSRPLEESIRLINEIAPEHLEVFHRNSRSIIPRIRNAGAIFSGEYSPAVAGDYIAGPSHVLPTNRAARFSSGLSVQTFLKRTSYIEYSKDRLMKDALSIKVLAKEVERMPFHSKAIKVREEEQ